MPVPAEYALANRVDHPKTVYLPEAEVTGKLNTWLGQAFTSPSLDATLPGSPTLTARSPSTGPAWTPGEIPP